MAGDWDTFRQYFCGCTQSARPLFQRDNNPVDPRHWICLNSQLYHILPISIPISNCYFRWNPAHCMGEQVPNSSRQYPPPQVTITGRGREFMNYQQWDKPELPAETDLRPLGPTVPCSWGPHTILDGHPRFVATPPHCAHALPEIHSSFTIYVPNTGANQAGASQATDRRVFFE